MAWTTATFKTRWAEFSATADALVQAALDEASRRTDARVFGTATDDAVGLLAAHLLSISPFGQQARLEAKEKAGESTYLVERKRLTRERAGGPWSSGQGPGGMLS